MQIPAIIEVKKQFEQLQTNGLIANWELPYEQLLTRRNAAIFFFTPSEEAKLEEVCQALQQYEHFSCRSNEEKRLSDLAYRVTFNQEETSS